MELPNDLQLKIMSKYDMDTRIKQNIKMKIKVPEILLSKIMECIQIPLIYIYDDNTVSFIKLGQSSNCTYLIVREISSLIRDDLKLSYIATSVFERGELKSLYHE
jgi:hypothetical protein